MFFTRLMAHVRHLFPITLVSLAATALTSCIDEDLSDCGEACTVQYRVQLSAHVPTQVQAALTSASEQLLAPHLIAALAPVFSEQIRDLSLAFYPAPAGSPALSEQHEVGAAQACYTFFLAPSPYRHLAAAGVQSCTEVTQQGGGAEAGALRLVQIDADTVASHPAGLFTARRDLVVAAGQSASHRVPLYMQNCAAALVIDPMGQSVRSVRGCIDGLCTDFAVSDSLYTRRRATAVRLEQLPQTGCTLLCLYGVGLPSPDAPAARRDGRGARAAGLWQVCAYVTTAAGKVTETRLHVPMALRAGQLCLLKARLQPDGSLLPNDPEVSASVTLDWQPGGIYEPEM